MGKEFYGKSFKSGNSVAIRIPAALGVEPNREWTIEWVGGELHLRAREPEPEYVDVTAFWGKATGLQPLKLEERVFVERELDWNVERPKRDV